MIYFDNAATTYPKPDEVYSFMDRFYRDCGVNVGRGQHEMASKANSMVEETKDLLKELLNCKGREIAFTPSATESLNVILQGLMWNDGYTVYITPFEHNSVTRILNYLKNIYKINVIELAVDRNTLEYDLGKIKYSFQDKRPNTVIMSHASNVCGLITPIEQICDMAKVYNATTVIDMAQTAGLIPTDLSKIQADYVVFAAHKTLYGSFGLGGIILDRKSNIKPLIYGGTGTDSANQGLPETIPEKFEAGSQNIQAIAGLNASIKWIKKTGVYNIYNKEKQYIIKLIDLLQKYQNIEIVGYKDEKSNIGVISCTFEGYSSDNIGQVLNEKGIAVRTGLHCSPSAHKFFGTFPNGTVRFSVSYFNKEEDFEKLKETLEYICESG